MTNIEQKALELVNEVAQNGSVGSIGLHHWTTIYKALCRAIEQHEAFRQQVSDAVEADINKQIQYGIEPKFRTNSVRFIIAKPDPLVEALHDMDPDCRADAESLRAALAKRGLEIREKE